MTRNCLKAGIAGEMAACVTLLLRPYLTDVTDAEFARLDHRGNVASTAASFAWLVSGLPRSLAATWKREGEPTSMPLYMGVHNT
jgi:hypothetical protein